MARRRWILVGPALLAMTAAAAGHPHVWVTLECAFALDDRRDVVSVSQTWSFDPMYSSYVLAGSDANRDRRYSAAELSKLTEVMTASLRQNRFFTKATLDDEEVGVADPTDVRLHVDPTGDLVLSFNQEFPQKPSLVGKAFRLEVRDLELFVDFKFSKARFGEITPAREGCSAALQDDQPPLGADPEKLMNDLINGPLLTLASGVTLRCR